jgi:hypothetical protein
VELIGDDIVIIKLKAVSKTGEVFKQPKDQPNNYDAEPIEDFTGKTLKLKTRTFT